MHRIENLEARHQRTILFYSAADGERATRALRAACARCATAPPPARPFRREVDPPKEIETPQSLYWHRGRA